MKKPVKTFKFSKPINLYCFTDVHIGAKEFDKVKFDKAVAMLMNDKNGYCFFNGDNLEFTPNGYHGAENEQILDNNNQIHYFASLLKKLGKKVLFFRTGNHEARAAHLCDVRIYEHLSRETGIYEAHRGMEEIHFFIKGKKFRVVTSHGEGGNSRRSIQNMQFTYPGADLYFIGHTHEMSSNIGHKSIITDRGFEEFRPQIEICGGSFLGWSDYARSKNMRPTETGCFILCFDDKIDIIGVVK